MVSKALMIVLVQIPAKTTQRARIEDMKYFTCSSHILLLEWITYHIPVATNPPIMAIAVINPWTMVLKWKKNMREKRKDSKNH